MLNLITLLNISLSKKKKWKFEEEFYFKSSKIFFIKMYSNIK